MLGQWLKEINAMADGKYNAALKKLIPLKNEGYSVGEIDGLFIDKLKLSNPANYGNLKWTNHKNFGMAYTGHSAKQAKSDAETAAPSKSKPKKQGKPGKIILASFPDLGDEFYTLGDDRYFSIYPTGAGQYKWGTESNLVSSKQAAWESFSKGSNKWGFSLSGSNIIVIDIDSNEYRYFFDAWKDKTYCGWKLKPDGTLSAHLYFATDKLIPKYAGKTDFNPPIGVDLLGNAGNFSVNFDADKMYNGLPLAFLTQDIIDEVYGIQGAGFFCTPNGTTYIDAIGLGMFIRIGEGNAAVNAPGGAGKTHCIHKALQYMQPTRFSLIMKEDPYKKRDKDMFAASIFSEIENEIECKASNAKLTTPYIGYLNGNSLFIPVSTRHSSLDALKGMAKKKGNEGGTEIIGNIINYLYFCSVQIKPYEYDSITLIIDEAGMLPPMALKKASEYNPWLNSPRVRLVLLGDIHQTKPIFFATSELEQKMFFDDSYEKYRLYENFRNIKMFGKNFFDGYFWHNPGGYIHPDSERAFNEIAAMCIEYMEADMKPGKDFVVLCHSQDDRDTINLAVKKLLYSPNELCDINLDHDGKAPIDSIYAVGEIVVFREAISDIKDMQPIRSGTFGEIVSISANTAVVKAEGKDRGGMPKIALIPLVGAEARKISSAYCRTIHQSQGMDFDNVLVYFPPKKTNTRELLYTALTRAKGPQQKGGQPLHIWAKDADDIKRVLMRPFEPVRAEPDNFADLIKSGIYTPTGKVARIKEAIATELADIASLGANNAEEELREALTAIKAMAMDANAENACKAIAEYWKAKGAWLNFRLFKPESSISINDAIVETIQQNELPHDAIAVMLIYYAGNGGIIPDTLFTLKEQYEWMLACYKRTKNGGAIVNGLYIKAVRNMRTFRHANDFYIATNLELKSLIENRAIKLGHKLEEVERKEHKERSDKIERTISDEDFRLMKVKDIAVKYGISTATTNRMKAVWKANQ